jgi:hypothetical protein
VSTSSSGSRPAASIAARISGTRLVTPVEVSLCTTITAAMPGSSRRIASARSGSAPWRQSPGTQTTSSPRRSAIARHSVAKWPVSNASTRSPGESVLTSAASQAPVPDEG